MNAVIVREYWEVVHSGLCNKRDCSQCPQRDHIMKQKRFVVV